jgi:DNA-binding transcriptional ArsR family regulator
MKNTQLFRNSNVSFCTKQSKDAELVLRAVNNKTRIKIMNVIFDYEKRYRKLITVTELYEKMKIEQSVASQHLAILRKANILNYERKGKFVHYGVSINKLNKLFILITNINKLEDRNYFSTIGVTHY